MFNNKHIIPKDNLENNNTNYTHKQHKKWEKFTYFGKETTYITKLLKNTDVNIAFRTENTLKKHLHTTTHIKNKYLNAGVYKLKCEDCHKYYTDQTGRTFHERYEEHIRSIRNSKDTTGYTYHILNTGHTYGPIDDKVEIVKLLK
jgi:transposase-like protein